MLHFFTLIVNFINEYEIKVYRLTHRLMGIRWQKLVFKVGVWLALEAFFGYVGTDTIADYSEFIFRRNSIALHR